MLVAAERDEGERARWREGVARLDPRLSGFVDQCGTLTSMVRLRARAPRGERACGRVPRNRGPNTTLIASMGAGGMGPCLAVEGATTRAVFEAYVERVLAPSLSPGQVVVLDNLAAHKGERVRRLVEARGCELLFLPPYSPDLSPIEEAFSKLKALLRRAAARTRGALLGEAIGRALDAVTAQDARGWFAHCATPSRLIAREYRCEFAPNAPALLVRRVVRPVHVLRLDAGVRVLDVRVERLEGWHDHKVPLELERTPGLLVVHKLLVELLPCLGADNLTGTGPSGENSSEITSARSAMRKTCIFVTKTSPPIARIPTPPRAGPPLRAS